MKQENLSSILFSKMLMIRTFEEEVLKLFSEGKLFGTTHAYIGQEANAVGVISNLKDDDIIVSNHRCHGHYLAFKNNPYALLCEMMGKQDGLCSGRGGSQHICDGNIFSNGVQGGIVPLAAGLAFAEKYNNTNKIVVVFIGDGTLGEGVVYEVLNMISKWQLPLLIVVENNRYAQSTKIEQTLAGNIVSRFESFDITTHELSTFNVLDVYNLSQDLILSVREEKKPSCLVINTYRFASHSKSDDGRDAKEVESWKSKHDPLEVLIEHLDSNFVNEEKRRIQEFIKEIAKSAIEAPLA